MGNRLDRIAVVVDDLDAVAADLEALLGITFVVRDLDTMGIRVGLGEDGIEMVEKTSSDCDVERFWRGPLMGSHRSEAVGQARCPSRQGGEHFGTQAAVEVYG